MNRRDFLRSITLSTIGLAVASGRGETAPGECQHDRLDAGEQCPTPTCDYVKPLPPPSTLGKGPFPEDQISLSWNDSLKDAATYHYEVRLYPKE